MGGWASWGPDVSFLQIVLYQLSCPWTPCFLKILPVYEPNEMEKADSNLYAKNVQAYVEQNSNFQSLPTNRLDCKLLEHGLSKNYDMDNFICWGANIEEKYGSKVATGEICCDLLDYFHGKSENTGVFEGIVFSD